MGMSQNRNSSSSESLCHLICMTVLKSIANQTRETKAGRSARLLNLGFPRGAFDAPLFLCSQVLLVITGSRIRSALNKLISYLQIQRRSAIISMVVRTTIYLEVLCSAGSSSKTALLKYGCRSHRMEVGILPTI